MLVVYTEVCEDTHSVGSIVVGVAGEIAAVGLSIDVRRPD
jgi:hypothetical protein